MTDRSAQDRWFESSDGTRLFARDTGDHKKALTPLLCLPGLTRNSRDFDPIFDEFAVHRRIIAMDFRGRGRSAFADPASYRPDVELQDTLAFLAALNVPRVALLGTSRGGIVGLLMAHLAAEHVMGLMLNDIGCRLETAGLLHIKSYIGTPKYYASWHDVARAFASSAMGFHDVDLATWERVARRIYVETQNGICPSHDPELAQNLPSEHDIRNGKVAELWSFLPAMNNKPFALLHGEGSALLSTATVVEMQKLSPHLQTTTIPKRGHVPFLDEPESVAAINAWLLQIDAKEKGR